MFAMMLALKTETLDLHEGVLSFSHEYILYCTVYTLTIHIVSNACTPICGHNSINPWMQIGGVGVMVWRTCLAHFGPLIPINHHLIATATPFMAISFIATRFIAIMLSRTRISKEYF